MSFARWHGTVRGVKGFISALSVMLASAATGQALAQEASEDGVEVIEVKSPPVDESFMEDSARALDVVDLENQRLQPADMGNILRQTRGITLRQSGGLGTSTQLTLNGLSGQQVPVYVDGVPIELSGLPRDPSTLPVSLVRQLQVYKGVVPVEYGGDALGGALNFETYSPEGGSAYVGYELGSFGTQRLSADVSLARGALYGRATGFFDDTDNDFAVAVDIPQPNGRLVPDTVDRFHDAYRNRGASLAVGVRDTVVANTAELRFFAADRDKELQHGIRMGDVPFGAVRNGEENRGLTARYDKYGVIEGVDVELLANYTRVERRLVDLSRDFFNWRGEVTGTRSVPGELGFGFGLDQTLNDDFVFVRANLFASVADDHTLVFNLTPSLRTREVIQLQVRGDGSSRTLERVPGEVLEVTAGLSHRSRWLTGLIENDLFVKGYLIQSQAEEAIGTINLAQSIRTEHQRLGVGDAIVWRPFDSLRVNASYELATRLPEPNEILGDGALIAGNPELAPETSHNVNLAASLELPPSGIGDLDLTAWVFWREVDDLIFQENTDVIAQFRNIAGARVLGVETAVRWSAWQDRISVQANGTWEEARNRADSGDFARFLDDRIPNRPYFYGGARARAMEWNVFAADDQIELYSNARYTHPFFFSFESAGDESEKNVIPRQLTFDVGATYVYSLPGLDGWTFATSLEARNVNDAELFDFLFVPRPGRAFFAKLNVSRR